MITYKRCRACRNYRPRRHFVRNNGFCIFCRRTFYQSPINFYRIRRYDFEIDRYPIDWDDIFEEIEKEEEKTIEYI